MQKGSRAVPWMPNTDTARLFRLQDLGHGPGSLKSRRTAFDADEA